MEQRVTRKKLKGTGNKWFFAQMLLGDRTDNIPGIRGEIGVYKLLEGENSEKYCAKLINELYFDKYKDENVIYEIADLVYIMDNENIRGSDYIRSFL